MSWIGTADAVVSTMDGLCVVDFKFGAAPFTLGRLEALRIAAVRAVVGGALRDTRTERAASGTVSVVVTRVAKRLPNGTIRVRPRVRYYLNGKPVRAAAIETRAAAGIL